MVQAARVACRATTAVWMTTTTLGWQAKASVKGKFMQNQARPRASTRGRRRERQLFYVWMRDKQWGKPFILLHSSFFLPRFFPLFLFSFSRFWCIGSAWDMFEREWEWYGKVPKGRESEWMSILFGFLKGPSKTQPLPLSLPIRMDGREWLGFKSPIFFSFFYFLNVNKLATTNALWRFDTIHSSFIWAQ